LTDCDPMYCVECNWPLEPCRKEAMKVAFTGPSRSIRVAMGNAAENYVKSLAKGVIVISGGAHGIDTIVAETALDCGLRLELVVPEEMLWNKQLLNYSGIKQAEIIPVTGAYRDRNERMLEEADKLAAFLNYPTFYRSGEWMTVNIAHRKNVPVEVVEWR